MNKKLLIAIVVLLVVIVGGIYIISNKTSKPEINKVSFGYQPFGNNLAFFVAQEKGFFAKRGIEVVPEKIISANDAANAIVKGTIIGDATVPLNVVLNIEENDPGLLKIFMVKTTSKEKWSDYLLVKKGSDITTIEQLKGKKVGGYPGTAQQTLIKLILKKFMDEKDITTIELAPNIQLQALDTKQVDAILTYDELAIIALQNNVAQVLEENPLGKYVMSPLYGFPYVLSTKFIQENPKATKAVVEAMNEASDFIKSNEAESRQIMAKWGGTKSEIVNSVNLWDQTKAENIDKDAMQKLADIFYENGVTKKKIETAQLIISDEDLK